MIKIEISLFYRWGTLLCNRLSGKENKSEDDKKSDKGKENGNAKKNNSTNEKLDKNNQTQANNANTGYDNVNTHLIINVTTLLSSCHVFIIPLTSR